MARDINIENLDADDVAYIEARQWMISEIELQGLSWKELREEALGNSDDVDDENKTPEGDDGSSSNTEKSNPEAGNDEGDDGDKEGPEDDDVDYEDLTIPQIHEELDARELEYPSKANKAELIAILEKDDEADAESE